ncbi:MAG: hypothetical protein I8H71_03375, partial [Xanthomonadaceae bacterium]|nr:hypothetical protein [Xanthomonadaceae bacterium]
MKPQLPHWRSSALSRADVLPHCATTVALNAEIRPNKYRLSKMASLMAAFMATTLLAACGGGDSSSGQSAAPVTAAPVTTPPVTEPAVTTPPVTTPPVDPGTRVGAAPTASGVGISGTAQVGKLLTGIYSYADADNDPQGASTFRWLRNGVA